MKAILLFLIKLIVLSILAVLVKNIILIFYPYTWLTYDEVLEYLIFMPFGLIVIGVNSLFRLSHKVQENIILNSILGFLFSCILYYLSSVFLNPYSLSFKLHPKILIFCLPLLIVGFTEPFLNRLLRNKLKK